MNNINVASNKDETCDNTTNTVNSLPEVIIIIDRIVGNNKNIWINKPYQ